MTDSAWRNCRTELPDWGDGGPAEFMRDDGSIVRGQISVDALFTGEDEIPTTTITAEDGSCLGSIHDFKSWRPTS